MGVDSFEKDRLERVIDSSVNKVEFAWKVSVMNT